MGLLPDQFYDMEIEDFSLKVEGFLDARIWLERSLRRLGQVLQAPHVDQKAPSMLRQWPISKDDEIEKARKEMLEEQAIKTQAELGVSSAKILKMFIDNAQKNIVKSE